MTTAFSAVKLMCDMLGLRILRIRPLKTAEICAHVGAEEYLAYLLAAMAE